MTSSLTRKAGAKTRKMIIAKAKTAAENKFQSFSDCLNDL